MSLNLTEINQNSLKNVIDYYLNYYASGSSHTAKAKRLDLKKFIAFLTNIKGYSKSDKLKLADWDHSSSLQFAEECLLVESPATVSRRLATLKHCGRTLADQLPNFKNPTKELKTPKVQTPTPKSLSTEELGNIFEKALSRINHKNSFIRYRNQIILCFLLETGLRADEVRLLRMSQIDDDVSWIKNVRTKGKRYRNVYLNSKIQEILIPYLNRRHQELGKYFKKLPNQIDQKLPLFISTYKVDLLDPQSFLMGSKTLWRAINEFSSEISLHPHLLRHTFAMELLDSSKDIRLVSQALGHGDVKITMRYTERSELEIAQALENKVKKTKKS